MSIHVSIHMSIHMSIYMSHTCLCTCLYTCLCTCLYHMSMHMSAGLGDWGSPLQLGRGLVFCSRSAAAGRKKTAATRRLADSVADGCHSHLRHRAISPSAHRPIGQSAHRYGAWPSGHGYGAWAIGLGTCSRWHGGPVTVQINMNANHNASLTHRAIATKF